LTLFVGYYTIWRVLNMIYFVNSLHMDLQHDVMPVFFLPIWGIIMTRENKIGLDLAAFYAIHIRAEMSVL